MNHSETTRPSRKKAPEGFYTASEAAEKLGMPTSTFQTRVRKHDIPKETPPGRKEGFYRKEVIDRMAAEKQRNATKQGVRQVPSYEPAETDWVTLADEPYAYVLDCELYGVENSVSPETTWTWWEKNPRACMILYNRENRKDIWGLLSIIPMEEETIFRLLRGEMEEKDIRAEHVLTYEKGHKYSCYVAAASLRSERKKYFGLLLHRVMDYWCEQYPDIQITKLYAFALDEDEGDGWRLIRKLYFAPRYDIGENAWELRLDRKNPSPILQRFQQCLEQKQTRRKREYMSPVLPVEGADTSPETPGVVFERAAPQDLPACIEISRAIFGGGGTTLERRLALMERNPDIFFVLRSKQEIVGYTSLVALTREKIERILREEEHPGDITPEDIQEFVPGKPLNFYIMAVCVRPGFSRKEKRLYAARLILGLAEDVLLSFAQRGLVIQNFFARSRMPDGMRLLEDMRFKDLDLPRPAGSEQRLFVLNVETSESLFVKRYREALREQQKG